MSGVLRPLLCYPVYERYVLTGMSLDRATKMIMSSFTKEQAERVGTAQPGEEQNQGDQCA